MLKKQGLYDPVLEHDACGVGFVVNVNGERSHEIVENGIQILCNLVHRGAVGADLKTGDGAGMTIQIPHKFFSKIVDFDLPDENSYGVGMLFLPRDGKLCEQARAMISSVVQREGGKILGWRQVPTCPEYLGDMARSIMPSIWQVFITVGRLRGIALNRELYILRKCIENKANSNGWNTEMFYIVSMSAATLVYKGMFVAPQFANFYPDFKDHDFSSALALIHQRYSTNTFPSWPLAQPFRFLAHNGEINTLRGNINKMMARERTLSSNLFGNEIAKLLPVINPDLSDSAIFDNVYELLYLGGRSLEHSMMMMIPEAFGPKYYISEAKRAFFEYHAAVMEPWDGPAAITFTDGVKVGATLD
ncbi:MAG: glutamate synthase subunit alpha, partial [Candidatus Omnitrophica bacterium]|nr:glutamate synthase subunit alpha [Candidatus Omnitrophota bacterium]